MNHPSARKEHDMAVQRQYTCEAQAAYEAGFRAGNNGAAEPIPAEHADNRDAYNEGYFAGLDACGARTEREFATPLRLRWR